MKMRREQWPFVAAVIGLFGGGMISSLLTAGHAEALDHFGSYLTGLSAFLAVAFAAIKGSQEFDDWKQRRRDEKASEVAGQVIIAAARFSDALRVFANEMEVGSDPVRSEGEKREVHLSAVIDARAAYIQTELKAYEDARLLAEAYLPDGAVSHVRGFWNIYVDMRIGWSALITGVRDASDMKEKGKQRLADCRAQIGPKLEALFAEMRGHTVGAQDDRSKIKKSS